MARKAICAIHGSYDAQLPICPECARESRDMADDRTRVIASPGSEDPLGAARLCPPAEDRQLRRKPASDAEADDDGTLIVGRRRGVPAADTAAASAQTRRRGLLGWLIVKNGARRGQVYRADRGTVIGRQGIGVLGEDPSLAESDAAVGILDIRDGRFVIRPSGEPFMELSALKGATQGAVIEVNGIPVEGERTLRQDDEIGIGDLEYVLKILPPEQD